MDYRRFIVGRDDGNPLLVNAEQRYVLVQILRGDTARVLIIYLLPSLRTSYLAALVFKIAY